ncbi:MAG: tetratricopeptide repeat protein [Planctomycetota bacterium]
MAAGGAVSGYTARDVARLLHLSPGQVRAYARSGLVEADRGSRGEYRFSFRHLVLLRAAKDLVAARVPRRRIRSALQELRRRLPRGRSLSGLQIAAEGERVVVHDGTKRWNPESGQLHFRFGVDDLARRAAPLARRQAREVRDAPGARTADDWYEVACDLEAPSPEDSRRAYGRALELDPDHVPAHVNLGRLLHEGGDPRAAEAHYRAALRRWPGDATAAFNLGVALEDQRRDADALAAYEQAIRADPGHADAHYNAAGLCRRLGRHPDALGHLKRCRELTGR